MLSEEFSMPDSAIDLLHFEGPTGYEHSVRADFCMNDTLGEYYFEIDVVKNEVGGQVIDSYHSNITRILI